MRLLAACAAMAALCPTAAAGPHDRRPIYGDAPAIDTPAVTADDWLALGLERYEAGDFKGAIDAFVTGNKLDPRPAFLFAIAQAERRRGDCGAAIIYYERFLATSPPESQAEAARDQRDRCEHAVGATPVAEPTLPAPTLIVQAPEPEPEQVRVPPPRPVWRDPLVLGLGTGAVIASIAGVTLLRTAVGAADDAMAADTYDAYAGYRDRAYTARTYGVISLSAGIALGAATALAVWKPWRRADVAVSADSVAIGGTW